MAGFWQLASMLREQVNATAWRSDVLKPLAWLIGMLILLVALLAFAKAPEWLMIWIAVTLLVSVALYGVSYAICFFVDRDALRSESYSLNKMAIEQKLIGDSTSGLFDPDETISGTPLAHDTVKQIEGRS
jgi:hypothetical protein